MRQQNHSCQFSNSVQRTIVMMGIPCVVFDIGPYDHGLVDGLTSSTIVAYVWPLKRASKNRGPKQPSQTTEMRHFVVHQSWTILRISPSAYCGKRCTTPTKNVRIFVDHRRFRKRKRKLPGRTLPLWPREIFRLTSTAENPTSRNLSALL